MESNIQKIKIKNISYVDAVSQKTGKSYTKCFITTSNDTMLSGFKSVETEKMKEGDVVDLVIEQKDFNGKTYYNFKPVKASDRLEQRVFALEDAVRKMHTAIKRLEEKTTLTQNTFSENIIDEDENPFEDLQ